MHRIKKALIILFRTLFFFGYFYIIFCSFWSLPAIATRMDAIKWLLLSFSIAVLLPGIICWQAHYIRQLEERVTDLGGGEEAERGKGTQP